MRVTEPTDVVGTKRRREPTQQSHATAVSFPDNKRIALADVTNQSQPQQQWPEAIKPEHEQVVPSGTSDLVDLRAGEEALGLHPSSSDSSFSSASSASSGVEVAKSTREVSPTPQRSVRLAAPSIRRGRTRRFIDIDAKSTDPAECATYCKDIFRTLFHEEVGLPHVLVLPLSFI